MKCEFCGEKIPPGLSIYAKEVFRRGGLIWKLRRFFDLPEIYNFDTKRCLDMFEKEHPDLAVAI